MRDLFFSDSTIPMSFKTAHVICVDADVLLPLFNFVPRSKKVVLFSKIGQAKVFLSLTCPQSQMCITICFLFQKIKTHRHTKSKRN